MLLPKVPLMPRTILRRHDYAARTTPSRLKRTAREQVSLFETLGYRSVRAVTVVRSDGSAQMTVDAATKEADG